MGSSSYNLRALGIITMGRSKFPQYASIGKRTESFSAWPDDMPVKAEDMVSAGLVYTGVGDSVRCYHCGGGLRNWEPGDKPMLEHAIWYPKCENLLLVKGQEYLDAAGRGEDLDLQTALENDAVREGDMNCVAAQSCTGFGTEAEIKRAMKTFIAEHNHDRFTASELLSIVMDQQEKGVVEEEEEKKEDDEKEEDEEELAKLAEQNERLKEERACKICCDHPASIVLLPCGHMDVCPMCASAVTACPMCRTRINGRVRAVME